MSPHPSADASMTRNPTFSSCDFSAAPTRVIPPAIYPATASARSFVAVITCDLGDKRRNALHRRGEHVHVDVRRSENHRPDLVRDCYTVTVVNLTQRFHAQHGAHAVRDHMDAADARTRHEQR